MAIERWEIERADIPGRNSALTAEYDKGIRHAPAVGESFFYYLGSRTAVIFQLDRTRYKPEDLYTLLFIRQLLCPLREDLLQKIIQICMVFVVRYLGVDLSRVSIESVARKIY